ncbi:MAG: 2'-5' RNA ligase family protein [Chitinophagaceae bacterium]
MEKKAGNNSYNRIYEYLVVIAPDEKNWHRLRNLRVEFANQFDIDHAKYGKPHLYLANFIQLESLEPEIVFSLEAVTSMNPPFRIEMNGFDHIDNHNIHVNTRPKINLQFLVDLIREMSTKAMTLNKSNEPYFIHDPHFTIARKLTKSQFKRIWPHYENRSFVGDFQTTEMVLLRREIGNLGYEQVKMFPFEVPAFHSN